MLAWRGLVWLLTACVTIGVIADKPSFSSVAAMTKLQLLRDQLVSSLSSYADKLEEKINFIQTSLVKMEEVVNNSRDDPEEYLSNPLNSFALIRHMHRDWAKWQLYMEEAVGEDEILKVSNLIPTLPTSQELKESMEAMQRVQEVYRLSVDDFANGVVHGQFYGMKLNAIESYAMGLHYFEQHDYPLAAKWFKVTTEKFPSNFTKVMEFLGVTHMKAFWMHARALLNQERQPEALNVVEAGLRIEPHDAKLLSVKADVEMRLRTAFSTHIKPHKKTLNFNEKLCSGGDLQRPSRLTCRFTRVNSPFLRLAPFKAEILHHDPLAVLYHDVIYPSEIEVLKATSRPMVDASCSKDETTSSQASLSRRINRRVGDMLGFHVNNVDDFQITNYGLGDRLMKYSQGSNKIVGAVLFYLSDVEEGGATVLPNSMSTIFPSKGSALLWRNLRKNGSFDSKLSPIECPVIVGSKWVMTKQILADDNGVQKLSCYNK